MIPICLFQIGFYEISKPGEEERVVRYEADDEHGFKANVTYNDPSGKSFVFQNRYLKKTKKKNRYFECLIVTVLELT